MSFGILHGRLEVGLNLTTPIVARTRRSMLAGLRGERSRPTSQSLGASPLGFALSGSSGLRCLERNLFDVRALDAEVVQLTIAAARQFAVGPQIHAVILYIATN